MHKPSYEKWLEDGKRNSWTMPDVPAWKRLPIIRRIRAFRHSMNVQRHNSMWRAMGAIPTGYDEWVLWGMAHGLESKQ